MSLTEALSRMSETESKKVPDALRTDLAHDPEGRALALVKRFFELQRQSKALNKQTASLLLAVRCSNKPETRKNLIRHRMNVIKLTEQTTAVSKEVVAYFQEANNENGKVIEDTTKLLVTECAEKKDRLEVLEEHEKEFIADFKKRCEPFAKDHSLMAEMLKDDKKITRNALKAMFCMALTDDFVSVPDDWRIAYEIQDVQSASKHIATAGKEQQAKK